MHHFLPGLNLVGDQRNAIGRQLKDRRRLSAEAVAYAGVLAGRQTQPAWWRENDKACPFGQAQGTP
jgi:hypothetical protein